MFQGMARGKVGDVVFYRMDGEQMSRVRNRHPKNPKTIAQLYQRAIMATIVRAYSAGSEIFDHSFEGKSVGMENMRTFLSRNMTVLRGQIKNDIDNKLEVSKQVGRVVAPKSPYPVPVNGLIISEGTYNNGSITLSPADESRGARIIMPNFGKQDETLADYAKNNNFIAGDIYTLVFFIVDKTEVIFSLENPNSDYTKQFAGNFGYLRMIVKSVDDDTILSRDATFGDLFVIDSDGKFIYDDIISTAITQQVTPQELISIENAVGTIGLIHSREDRKLRSTSVMVPFSITQTYGIVSEYIIDAWEKEIDSLGNSQLILEGGNAANYNNSNNFPQNENFTTNFENPITTTDLVGKVIKLKNGKTGTDAVGHLTLTYNGNTQKLQSSGNTLYFSPSSSINWLEFTDNSRTSSTLTIKSINAQLGVGAEFGWE